MGSDGEGFTLAAFDQAGVAVASVASVVGRRIDPDELQRTADRRALHQLKWLEVRPEATGGLQPSSLTILGEAEIAGFEGAERHADLAALLLAIENGGTVPEVVLAAVRSVGPDDGDLPGAAFDITRHTLELAQSWIRAAQLDGSRLVLLTEGGVAAAEGEFPDLAAAPVWGLVRSALSEHPGRFSLIDTDGSTASLQALTLSLALEQEPQLAVRAGQLLAPRLSRIEPDGEEASARPIDPDRTILISGGTRGLGARVARHLVSAHGARHLILASRSGEEAEGARELTTELEELGAEVTIAACDAADREQLAALIDSIPEQRPLGAVVHSARVVDDGVLDSLDRERLAPVMRSKVDAAWNLHELTAAMGLSHFLLFSSAAGLLGSVGQASYAAANAFLDALAAHRHGDGLPATSMAWGAWAQEGESAAAADAAAAAHLERIGLAPMPSEQILGLFDVASGRPEALLVPAKLQGSALRALAKAGALPAILTGLVRISDRSRSSTLLERFAGIPEADREAVVLDLVCDQVAVVLGHDSAEEVEPDREFVELGFDSLAAVELRNRLVAATGLSLPVFALANNPTVAGVAQHVLAQATSVAAGLPVSDSPGQGLAGPTGGTFMPLLAEAVEQGTQAEFAGLLASASKFRATGTVPATDGEPRIVRLAEGSQSPSLVLIPSAIAMSGPQEYARFAASFRGKHTVRALPLLGFAPGEPLPGDVGLAARAQAETILKCDLGSDFALIGYSTGGWLAHAVAAELEGRGVFPRAVVLLDSYWPDGEVLDQLMPNVLTWMREAEKAGFPVDDDRLLAMAGYMRIFDEWQPTDISTPTIVIRAFDQTWDVAFGSDTEVAPWKLPHSSVTVEGNHFTMMQDHAEAAADAVRLALNARAGNAE
jgi:NAD(P)-dependent dehydrogenase (short-subunit alcohol dehydrogenase family)/thioesterase domain-containing protein/acyl carrier protein